MNFEGVLNTVAEITAFSVVIFVVILIIRAAFRKWLTPAVCYALWTILALRLILPVTFQSNWRLVGEVVLPVKTQVVTQLTTAPEATPYVSPASFTDSPENTAETTHAPQPTSTPMQDKQTAKEPGETHLAAPDKSQTNAFNTAGWLTVAWGLGAAIMLAVSLFLSILIRRDIARSGKAISGGTQRVYQSVVKRLNVKRPPQVYSDSNITSPCITIDVSPRILVPEYLVKQGDEEVLTYAFMHELTHYTRGDHRIQILILILRAIYWFNPVVWIAAGMVKNDVENACDATLSSKLSPDERKRYAYILVDMYANHRKSCEE